VRAELTIGYHLAPSLRMVVALYPLAQCMFMALHVAAKTGQMVQQ
jgi:hypothetical protein